MNFTVISDTHLGDKDCGLVAKKNGKFEIDEFYDSFSKNMRTCDYMILLGDIFDFAIEDYSDAYEAGKVFLNRVVEDGFVKKGFIYIPGNHDFSLWPLIEYEANIINRLKKGKKVRKFQNSLPAIIDARDGNAEFLLYGVKPHGNSGHYEYGGMYLDNLIDREGITFNIAYPNLYLFTEEETILFTHGHYFGTYWSAMSDYGKDLTEKTSGENSDDFISLEVNSMDELVSINFPLNQLASSGVGESGKLGQIVNQVMHNLKNGNPGRVNAYVENLFKLLMNYISGGFSGYLKKLCLIMLKKKVNKDLEKAFHDYSTPQNNNGFLKENIKKVEKFYELTVKELKSLKVSGDDKRFLKKQLEKKYFEPVKMIYGHTHVPVSWNKPEKVEFKGKRIETSNPGGWLSRNKKNWRGAEIFFIDEKGVILSSRVM